MDLSFAYVTCGLLFMIVLLLFICYRDQKKRIEGFPYGHLIPRLVYNHLTGKITKNAPFNSCILSTAIELANEHSKEGLYMTHLARPCLMIYSEDPVKFFLNEKAAVDKSPEYEYMTQGLGHGLISSNGERWIKHRKLINPVFHIGMLKDKIPLFNEHAMALVKEMEKMVGKPSVDILDALKNNYFNALSESVFGVKQCEENKAENLKCFSSIDHLSEMTARKMIYPWIRWNFLLRFLSSGRKYLKDLKEFRSFITKVIHDMTKLVESKKFEDSQNLAQDTERFSEHLQKSFTYILLRQHFNDPSFTFKDLHDEVGTIFVSGYDTVTYSTMWCLFLLALNPEVQEKAFNEIESITDGYITYDDICNLTYLEAVIMESLRLYPTLPVVARNLTKDVQYGKYKVHKGTTIAFLSFGLHRNPDIYPNPESFEPERFFNSEPKKPWSYMPFSEGPRICIGKKYAIMEMKIFLSHVLRNYKIGTLDKREDILPCWNIALLPSRPVRMKIFSRNPVEMDCCIEHETNSDKLVQHSFLKDEIRVL